MTKSSDLNGCWKNGDSFLILWSNADTKSILHKDQATGQIAEETDFHFRRVLETNSSTVRSIQLPTQWVLEFLHWRMEAKRLGREAECSFPSTGKFKNARCLIKYRKNFTAPLPYESRDNSVYIAIRLGAGQIEEMGFDSREGKDIFLFSIVSTPPLGPVQWVQEALT
jgi:hypothetical protein